MKRFSTALCLLFVLLTGTGLAAQKADPDFQTYLKSVQGLDVSQPEDAQKAAQAFILYLQAAAPHNRVAIVSHMDKTLLVDGKASLPLEAILDDSVTSCVAKAEHGEVFARNMVEYMVGYGCIWFTFTDNKAEQPIIFAVNRVE